MWQYDEDITADGDRSGDFLGGIMKNEQSGTRINFKAVAVLAVVAIGYLVLNDASKDEVNRQPSEIAEATKATLIPENEAKFISIISDSRLQSSAAKNDMQVGGIKSFRDKDICNVIEDMSITDWVGKVKKISSNSDGKGVFSVEIAEGVEIKTWNNSISDMGYKTLMEPGSQIFQSASSLSIGDAVLFSGSFFEDKSTCIKESSLSLSGKVDKPEFIFLFSSVKPIE